MLCPYHTFPLHVVALNLLAGAPSIAATRGFPPRCVDTSDSIAAIFHVQVAHGATATAPAQPLRGWSQIVKGSNTSDGSKAAASVATKPAASAGKCENASAPNSHKNSVKGEASQPSGAQAAAKEGGDGKADKKEASAAAKAAEAGTGAVSQPAADAAKAGAPAADATAAPVAAKPAAAAESAASSKEAKDDDKAATPAQARSATILEHAYHGWKEDDCIANAMLAAAHGLHICAKHIVLQAGC